MRTQYCPACFQTVKTAGVCPFCGYDGRSDMERYPTALPPGTALAGRYIVGRVLGQGGFGITYLALDHRDGSRIALKEYFPDSLATRKDHSIVSPYTGDREEAFLYGRECFLSEAKTLAEFIGCESVVRVLSYFEENRTAYFTMEYLQGQSLLAYLKNRGGRIGYDEALRIILPVADALVMIHSKGIVHRDISPDNIFLTHDKGVKLIDFGAARFSVGDRSRSLDIVLKHGYAPAEQYTRRGRQGAFTDVYALAATIYRAITGKIPPDAVDRMSEDTLVPPSVLGVSLPRRGEDALLKALEVTARDRYQTMREFRDELLAASPALHNARPGSSMPHAKPIPTPPAQPVNTPPVQPVNNSPEEPVILLRDEPEATIPPAAIAAETPQPGVDYIIPNAAGADDGEPLGEEMADEEDYLVYPGDPAEESAAERQKKKFLITAAVTAMFLALIALTILIVTNLKQDGEDGSKLKLQIGKTWTVEDQWSLTINSVYKTSRRNPSYASDDIADIYIIDYTYTNLNYRTDNWGLYFSLSADAKDSKGSTCLSYLLDDLTAPEPVNPGESVTCRQAIAVYNAGGFTISGLKYSDKSHGLTPYPFEFTYDN